MRVGQPALEFALRQRRRGRRCPRPIRRRRGAAWPRSKRSSRVLERNIIPDRSAPARPNRAAALPVPASAKSAPRRAATGKRHEEAPPAARAAASSPSLDIGTDQDVLPHRARRGRRIRTSSASATRFRAASARHRHRHRGGEPVDPDRRPRRRADGGRAARPKSWSICRAASAPRASSRPRSALNGREISDRDMQPRARTGLPRQGAPRAHGHPFRAGRILDRRQPRHPRPARHVRPQAGGQHARRFRRIRRSCATSPTRSAAASSRSRRWSSSPYASGLACLVEDESELGVTVIDMGGGTTTIAVFFDGNLVFADSIPVGGSHVTNDIARGPVDADRPCRAHEDALRQRHPLVGRRARDDHRAAGGRGGRRQRQPRAEIDPGRRSSRRASRRPSSWCATASRPRASTRSPDAAWC